MTRRAFYRSLLHLDPPGTEPPRQELSVYQIRLANSDGASSPPRKTTRTSKTQGSSLSLHRLLVRSIVSSILVLSVPTLIGFPTGQGESPFVLEADASPEGAARAKELCDAMAWPSSYPSRGTYTGTTEEPSTSFSNSTSYTISYEGGVCHVILTNTAFAVKHGPHPRRLGETEC